RKLKAVIPGGSSAKVLRADERFKLKERQTDGSTVEREISLDDIPMDFDSLAAAGSMAGSGGVIVLDDSRDMVWALNNINKFYAHPVGKARFGCKKSPTVCCAAAACSKIRKH